MAVGVCAPVVMPAMRLVERSGRMEWMAAIAFSRPSPEHLIQLSRTCGPNRAGGKTLGVRPPTGGALAGGLGGREGGGEGAGRRGARLRRPST